MPAVPLRPSKAPNLIVARPTYDMQQQELFKNQLRLYFSEVDNLNQTVAQRVTIEGILFPDGTAQTTAWEPSYIEAFDRAASIAIPVTPTLLKPDSFLPPVNAGITYDPLTGEFTFQYEGVYSLSISLNIAGTNNNQVVYVYAQRNVGAGWVNNTNSGKAYKLFNNTDVQFVNPQSVYRAAGEKTRYYIYASNLGPTLVTQTLPGVTPTVYVPAIRIQFAGG
jgi:hypothetical protein